MWRDGHEDEAYRRLYLSPDPRDEYVLGELIDDGIAPIGPNDGSKYLYVRLKEERDSDPDFGKLVLVVHGEEWQAYCYVADIDFTGSEPEITPNPDEAEAIAWHDWAYLLLDLPVNAAGLL